MPKNATLDSPEWRGKVSVLNGRRWIEVPVIVRGRQPHVVTARAVKDAKAKLKRGTRITDLVVRLHKTSVGKVGDETPET